MLINDRIYGQLSVNEPIILELLETPQMRRLQKVHANGIYFYFMPKVDVTKYDHSIGVWHLLKRFEAPLAEQVAGILHDVSHKAFAHVVDHLYGSRVKEDHQDNLHPEIINAPEIKTILEKYGFSSRKIGDLKKWPLLDNELPNLCADRFDYTLRDATQVDFIDQPTIDLMLGGLLVDRRGFYFKTLSTAKTFGELSLKMCEQHWHATWGDQSFEIMAQILKIALEEKIISEPDFWLGDQEVLDKLTSAGQRAINQKLKTIKNIRQLVKEDDAINYDMIMPYKFRVIDPWVNNQRLTSMDEEFKLKFEAAKAKAKTGHYLKFDNFKLEE